MNIDERARRAAAAIREQAAAADADAVLERIRGERDRPRWLLPAGAAAVAVALAIAVVAVVLPRTDPRPVIDPVGDPGVDEPTDRPSEPKSDPTTDRFGVPPEPVPAAWERSGSEVFAGPGDQRAVAAASDSGHPRYVVVGSDAEQAAIWRLGAEDPVWRRVAPDLCGEASCTLEDVVFSNDTLGFVAAGSLDGLPMIWRSADGSTWRRADVTREGDPAGPTTLTVVADRSGLEGAVAFGHEDRADGTSRPVVFASRDGGDTWEEQPVDFTFDEAGTRVVDATLVPDGRILAVAQIGDGTWFLEERAGVWRLRPIGGEEFGVVSTFVHGIESAYGETWMWGSVYGDGDQDGRVWRSTDAGGTWTAMPGDLGGPGDQHVTSGTLLSAGYQAVGYEIDGGGSPPRPVVWALMDDGWERIDGGSAFDDPGAMLAIVQTHGHSALVVGDTTGPEFGGDADAVVWSVEFDIPVDPGCSTSSTGWESFGYDSGLPGPVEELREAIWGAAIFCDYEELERLALAGRERFTYSFGEDGAPGRYWRNLEEEGGQPLLELALLLQGPPGTIRTDLGTGSEITVHVWPSSFADDEGFVGYRVGITDDGDWVFFVAGD